MGGNGSYSQQLHGYHYLPVQNFNTHTSMTQVQHQFKFRVRLWHMAAQLGYRILLVATAGRRQRDSVISCPPGAHAGMF